MTLLERKKPMTIEAFLAFTETRPDEERWELIDGEPVLNASPSYNHQKIVINLAKLLTALERDDGPWEVLPGLGVKLSNTRMPIPDMLLRPRRPLVGNTCDDMIVAFEVLSPSTRSRDLRWKRLAYAELSSLQHYVVIGQEEIDVRCFDRANGWSEQRLRTATETISLLAVSVTFAIGDIYRGTGL